MTSQLVSQLFSLTLFEIITEQNNLYLSHFSIFFGSSFFMAFDHEHVYMIISDMLINGDYLNINMARVT